MPATPSASPQPPQPARPGYTIHKIGSECRWSYREHSHKGFGELVCLVRGELLHRINGREIVQHAGEILFARETDTHWLSGEHFMFVNVMFSQDWLSRLEQYLEAPGLAQGLIAAERPPCAQVPLRDQAHLAQILEQLLSNASSIKGCPMFAEFLLMVVTQYLSPLREQHFPEAMPDWLRESLVWLGDPRPHTPTLQELVRKSGRCHEHYSREFIRHMGIPPSRYLANLKIETAARMLLTTNHKLVEIAQAAGFENESYFFRLFRQCKGKTPREYRRLYGRRSIQR